MFSSTNICKFLKIKIDFLRKQNYLWNLNKVQLTKIYASGVSENIFCSLFYTAKNKFLLSIYVLFSSKNIVKLLKSRYIYLNFFFSSSLPLFLVAYMFSEGSIPVVFSPFLFLVFVFVCIHFVCVLFSLFYSFFPSFLIFVFCLLFVKP